MRITNIVLMVLVAGLLNGCNATSTQAIDAISRDVSALDVEKSSGDGNSVTRVDAGRLLDATAPPGSNSFGTISEPCLSLASLVQGDTAGFEINEFQFDGSPFDATELSEGGAALFTRANAGGSSRCSEVFSLELWQTCAEAILFQGETQIVYTKSGAMTDYTVKIQDRLIGVSVTRAYKGPKNLDYTLADAKTLLTKKLNSINESTANVAPESAWEKQILHIWTIHKDWSAIVKSSWEQLDPALRADTIVVVTVESGSDFVVTDTCDD